MLPMPKTKHATKIIQDTFKSMKIKPVKSAEFSTFYHLPNQAY